MAGLMIHRIDVQVSQMAQGRDAGYDPLGNSIRNQILELGQVVGSVTTGRIFLIDSDADRQAMQQVASQLLADPIVETAQFIDPANLPDDTGRSRIEIHLKPGVMDPVAASTEMAINDMGIAVRQVRTAGFI